MTAPPLDKLPEPDRLDHSFSLRYWSQQEGEWPQVGWLGSLDSQRVVAAYCRFKFSLIRNERTGEIVWKSWEQSTTTTQPGQQAQETQ